jgi:hypothetical protein
MVMNLISPLTLLAVPLMGSLIIISFPSLANKGKLQSETISPSPSLKREGLPSLIAKEAELGRAVPASGWEGSDKLNLALLTPASPFHLSGGAGERLSELKKETARNYKNSNLKKIAILTSLINFIISIIL